MKKLRQSGGYRTLASFQTTTIIYDATVRFCERFLDARSRTVDQMIHVARSSLEELLLDFEDYLQPSPTQSNRTPRTGLSHGF